MKLIPLRIRLCLLLTSIFSTCATPTTPATLLIPLYNATTALIVNLGYASYQGYYDSDFGLNVFKGCVATARCLVLDIREKSIDTCGRIRYAAPPTGKLRWQAPQTPARNNTLIKAVAQAPLCPQSGAAQTPAIYGFNSGPGDEDCLFLNVYAPSHAKKLPVVVWIRMLTLSILDPSLVTR